MGDAEGCCAACIDVSGNTAYLDPDGCLFCILRTQFITPKQCPYRKEGLP